MSESIVANKSRQFAVRIIRLGQYLQTEKKEFILSNQIIRSGTSIGANIVEALKAISQKEFLQKMYIAFKECNETMYWLDLLYATDYLSEQQFQSLNNDCAELQKILSSITKTTKNNQPSKEKR
ncbi:MAG: four helix bundle protein [Alloprevotella sp.]|nr:four helix bundle protein [Alloprevotella sp.]MDY4740524.1 four helix bundle protein [Alloprevotella sp.]MDY4873345.1 four helix bundle protein [Alloprevotella sp.]